ncbi:MmcQ/YjbR family DNA-binding protein [Phenylobacterium sp.]|uniref:MmcQ/YjbR family DNA-binding protein n=1 Tax=Phenylobacterium sp. TaxID=1871053 RepID=UPI0027343DD5|nr:MmcQ/YjbR family DNA-binding protein [Phenylobacterium sp.]MDP3660331.1 MmcQ/YjbR family DNA-binding protein [Phenylobacterium sp.]
MTPEALDAACRALAAVTMDVQWGGDHVYKIGGKMFAVAGSGGGLSIKVSDIAYEALTQDGQARPAPYLARAKWVRFDDLAALDPDEACDLLRNAHALVAAKLTRAARRDLGLR